MTQRSKQCKQHSTRIVTTTLFVGTLVLPWNAAEAEPAASAECNGNGVGDLAIHVPSERMALNTVSPVNVGAPNIRTNPGPAIRTEAVQLFDPMSMFGLPTNTYTPTFLHQHAPTSLNGYEPRFAPDDDGLLVVFSW
jgi:hypothetical protein